MKRLSLLSILISLFSFSTFAAPLQSLGNGEGELNVVAWAGYLERGETVEAFDWVTGYEDNTGCKVNIKTAGTSDEMVALMNEGGFDIVTASGYGKDLSSFALEDYTNIRHVMVNIE